MNTQTMSHPTTNSRAARLAARWPLFAALFALALMTAGGTDAHLVAVLVMVATAAPLGATAVGHASGAWGTAAVGTAAVVIGMLTAADAIALLLAVAVAVAMFGFVRGARVDRRALGARSAAFVCFAAIALAAMMIDPAPGAILAAVVAIGRGAWDLAGARRQVAAVDTFAEFSGVLCMGAGLALLAAWVG